MLTGILILLPLILSLVLFVLKDEKWIKLIAIAGSVAELVLALSSINIFVNYCHCNLEISISWLQSMGVSLEFGMDGISLLLVLLTTFLVPVILLSTWNRSFRKPSAFYGLILLMEMALVGVFTAYDGLMFYIFWEMVLIPAWFIVAIWNGKDRVKIPFKFFIYTFAGSIFMLAALIYIYFHTPAPHSFEWRFIYMATLTPAEQSWIFLAFFLAFAIKIPIFPFHTWQPDTYVESPAAGSMLLAGLMLKMGLYGMIRWMIPVCYGVLHLWGFWAILLALVGTVYASVIALRQRDMKRMAAYASIAHVGLIAAGIITVNFKAMNGAVLQMLSHGINIVGLFIIIDLIETRTKTRNISELGGIARKAPWLALFFMIILLANVALPLTNSFVGEFLLLLGIFQYQPWLAAFGGLTIILGAVYMLRIYQRVMLGETNPATENITDLKVIEMATIIPLVVMIFWIGLFPGTFISLVEPSLKELILNIHF